MLTHSTTWWTGEKSRQNRWSQKFLELFSKHVFVSAESWFVWFLAPAVNERLVQIEDRERKRENIITTVCWPWDIWRLGFTRHKHLAIVNNDLLLTPKLSTFGKIAGIAFWHNTYLQIRGAMTFVKHTRPLSKLPRRVEGFISRSTVSDWYST